MAGLYHGHVLEFPQIRVDCFTTPPRQPWLLPDPRGPHLPCRPAPRAQLYLLTHVHSDHLVGLSDSFTGTIICSPETKAMLLKLETEKERLGVVDGVRETRKLKYEGLRPRVVGRGTKDEHVVDMIEAVPYGVPRIYDLGFAGSKPVKVTITLIDANHCPGSTMFLIASPETSVLHTGDIRADDLFLRSLRRNAALAPYFQPPVHAPIPKMEWRGGQKNLDRIYLDTSAMLGTGDMPEKEMVLGQLIEQMSLYPENTVFFLDVWCFGWEDVVKEVARCFNTPVHVDRYKKSVYSAIQTDPFLSECTTEDHTATRFHACERKARCDGCRIFDKEGNRAYNLDKLVVKVSMVEVKSAAYEIERQSFLNRLSEAAVGEGLWPFTIYCPIARHSPLPELQRLVKAFKPNALSPNTLVPQTNGMDYFLLPQLFGDCLWDNALAQLVEERDSWFKSTARFGEACLEVLTRAASSGLELADTDIEHLLARSASARPIGTSRRDHASDQVARSIPATTSATIHLAGPFQPSKVDDVEYDTDDDNHRERKRHKVKAPTTTRLPAGTDDWKKESCVCQGLARSSHRICSSDDHFDAKPPAGCTPNLTGSTFSVEDPPEHPRRKVREFRSSMLVDRDHLRALAGVASD